MASLLLINRVKVSIPGLKGVWDMRLAWDPMTSKVWRPEEPWVTTSTLHMYKVVAKKDVLFEGSWHKCVTYIQDNGLTYKNLRDR